MASNEIEKGSQNAVDKRLARHGHVSYLEIPAEDVQQSAAFYESVFGWRVEPRDAGRISFDDLSGDLIGSWITGRKIAREPRLLPYVYVDQIDRIVALVPACGGEVIKWPYPEGNLCVAVIRDCAGNAIGIWQAGPRT